MGRTLVLFFLLFPGPTTPSLCSFWVWLIIKWPGLRMLFSPYHALFPHVALNGTPRPPALLPFHHLWRHLVVPSPTRKTVTQVSSTTNHLFERKKNLIFTNISLLWWGGSNKSTITHSTTSNANTKRAARLGNVILEGSSRITCSTRFTL